MSEVSVSSPHSGVAQAMDIDGPKIIDSYHPLSEIIAEGAKKVREAREKEARECLTFHFLDNTREENGIYDFLSPKSGESAQIRTERFARLLELLYNPDKAAEASAVFKGTRFEDLMKPPEPNSERAQGECGLEFVVDQGPIQTRKHWFLYHKSTEKEFSSVEIHAGHYALIFTFQGHTDRVNECLAYLKQALFPEMPGIAGWKGPHDGLHGSITFSWDVPPGPRSLAKKE